MAYDSELVFLTVSSDLGILPDKRVNVVVCVEGPNDVAFLQHMSALLRTKDNALIDLTNDPRVVVIPIGGSSLVQWVQAHYLRRIGLPEIHIYDRDTDTPPKYEDAVNEVNARQDGSWATLTAKRETENYLHPDAISDGVGVVVDFGSNDDVPHLLPKLCTRRTCKLSHGTRSMTSPEGRRNRGPRSGSITRPRRE